MARAGANKHMHKAKKGKYDEFYTIRSDVENELRHYKKQFKGKTVLCNCDDPRVSSFFHYFSHNFEHLGLKKLITTCYKNQQWELFSEHKSEKAIYLEYMGDKNGNKVPDPSEIGLKNLEGDGDFRSEECIELLKQADIVVTNPPFSLFREYVGQLMEYKKKFLIIGDWNAVTYKDTFNFLLENKIWIGMNSNRQLSGFMVPSHYPLHGTEAFKDENGNRIVKSNRNCWFTNLNNSRRQEEIILTKKYNKREYPEYDNYNIINVDKVNNIPEDYKGIMGVPITFMNKHNPEQFEILGIANSARWIGFECYTLINGKKIYNRLLVRNKKFI